MRNPEFGMRNCTTEFEGLELALSFRIPHSTFRIMRNWFNQADATYRGDLREINELNFSRFDAKLEQRLAQLDAKWEQRAAKEQGVAQLDARLERGLGELRAELAVLRGEFRVQLEAEGKVLMRWIVGLWISAIGVIVAGLHFLPAARP